MADFLLDMEWQRCPEGYHRAPAPERSGAREWILPNSIFRLTYRPFRKYEMLFIAFAKIKTANDV